MKKFAKIITLVAMIAVIAAMSAGIVACNRTGGADLRFAAPEGTPALAIARLGGNIGGKTVDYAIVSSLNISSELADGKADLVIMPVNGGANLIRTGSDYKLVSVAVDGSLYMIGKKDGSNELTFEDIKGKKIACIGQTGVPGLVFRYVMSNNGIELISDGTPSGNQALVRYVSDGPAARQLLAGGSVDYAVVGEPAATQLKGALGLNAEMDMQAEYKNVNPEINGENYPQAGLFVRTSLYENGEFMNALFDELAASKEWVTSNPAEVQEYVKANLYEAAVFPAASIPRCSINAQRIDKENQNRVVAFLKNVMPKDNKGNEIDWDAARELIF